MKQAYLEALAYGGTTTKTDRLFSRLYALFVRDPDTNTGLGTHYLVDVVGATKGNCGSHLLTVFCKNHDIPLLFEGDTTEPIRDIVKRILQDSPPRCAIVIDTRDNELLQKVRTRIARTHCDLRYRRVIFCLTDQDMPSGSSCTSLCVPGSIDDKMTLLLYHIPTSIQTQAASLDLFRSLAESMTDYALFHPRVWRNVRVDGTLEEFLSSAHYQIAFETEWRNTMATRLKHILATTSQPIYTPVQFLLLLGGQNGAVTHP